LAYLLAILSALIGVSVPDSDSAQQPWRFVHITDAHVGASGGLDKLNEIVDEINAMDPLPEFVLDTGDVTEFGDAPSFKAYEDAMKRLKVPFHCTLGNHDTRWSGTGKAGFEGRLGPGHYSFGCKGWHFVVLDTSIRFDQHGYLGPEQLEWLRADLAAQSVGTPTVIACHHPPKFPNSAFMEGDDAFFEAIRGRNVRLVLTGHGHSFRKWTRDGVQLLMTKAVLDGAYRVVEVASLDVKTYIGWVGKTPALDTITPVVGDQADEAAASTPVQKLNPRVAWSKELGGSVEQPIAPLNQDRVIVGDSSGTVTCLDLRDGSTAWNRELGSSASVSDGCGDAAVVCTESGSVSRLDSGSGDEIWAYRCGAPVGGGAGSDGELVCFVDGNGILHALNADTGEQLWELQGMGPVQHAPAVTESGIFVANWASRVFRVSRDGKKMWEYTVPSNKYYSAGGGRPAVGNGLVVACCSERKDSDIPSVFALDASTGKLVWGVRAGSVGYCSPAIQDKRAYVTDLSGEVVCLSLDDGKTVWRAKTAGSIWSQHPCISGGRVFVCSSGGKITVLSAQTGSVIDEIDLGLKDTYCLSSPAVSGGRLVVGAMDGTLACLPLGDSK
jgi:outer membrane protein assembly factor BamB